MIDPDDLREKIARELHDFSCHALDPDDECGCWCGAGDRADIVIANAVQPAIEQAKAEGAREALTSQAAAALRTAEAVAAQVSTLPQTFRDESALARFIIENEWALDSKIDPSGTADWRETLNRVHDDWDGDTPEDIVSTIAAAVRLDRSFRAAVQEPTEAETVAAQGCKEWEDDARFVARQAVEYRDAHYPEEER